ncbi:MAG: 3-[(3aS,4S,7aS)-7a-methyl-1,5-dioxo-octahydro-1H-inden-4-yl]propanoyl:CoA ligase [Acidimicrobiales bacterium]|nr:MAG: fatty acid--CoA ligase family protein [Actinomycetota bacterium]MBV6508160.1 3-[(3aS,4S,7aS)-7a-methyl-1,5-dioxo-octahydro-1H-inden-4-yl]propanoyl:CoA ligase [Acidimicrobiales bacterium]RIK08184.1 MAG: fatty acid--CoA ligase [Acidobacteriota bacterium]
MPVDEAVRGDLIWGTIPGVLADAVSRFDTAEAIIDEEVRVSFGDLELQVLRATRAFLAAGVERGDRVSIWAPNIHEWVIAALALQSAGAVLVPINTRFKGAEAGYVLDKSGARVLLTVGDFLDADFVSLLRDARGGPEGQLPVGGLASLERIVVLRGDPATSTTAWADFLASGEVVSEDEARSRAGQVQPDDLSDILFTSGTTGNPKGVMCTHAQALRSFRSWSEVVGLREGDRYLIVNPFFHAFGYKAGWLSCLMMGATAVPQAVFDVPEVMRRVVEERITVLPGPPTLYQSILNHPDAGSFDMSKLRLAVTGAAVIPVELIHRMERELGFETIITGYGLTEACGIATMCRYDDDPETIATTSGRAIPDVEVRINDDEGEELARGEPGEVVVRGYNVMRGYFEDPAETEATIDSDGWLHTGDIGVMDERGYVQITDRKKDMFIMGGFNAYPAEIENLMLANEKIAQVAVVGVPDQRMGEVGMAYVVLRPGEAASEDEIAKWCRDNMANYKVPRYVELVDDLPLNASGKVLKYQLRERGVARIRSIAG